MRGTEHDHGRSEGGNVKLIRQAVPYDEVMVVRDGRWHHDWESQSFDPPLEDGYRLLFVDWDVQQRACHLTWVIEP